MQRNSNLEEKAEITFNRLIVQSGKRRNAQCQSGGSKSQITSMELCTSVVFFPTPEEEDVTHLVPGPVSYLSDPHLKA